jgi:Zn-dependent protease with chaperone function
MFVVGTVYGLALLLLILFTGLNARFRDYAERISRRRFVQVLIFGALLFLTLDVLSLPVAVYRHHLALDYGLSVQSWGSWAGDWLKAEALGTIISILLVWGLYAVIRRSPRRWWFYGWLGFIPFVLLLIFVAPIFIEPLFNKFEPLAIRQPRLIPQLEKVMQRGGLTIERSRMFEMQASDKVTTYNAYVTGIGASKRVVVWDNTSRELSTGEVLFIFGHEQGHYVLHHIWIMIGSMIAGLLAALFILYRSSGAVLRRWGPRWQIRDLSDWASLPAMLLVFSVLSLVAQPLQSAGSRYFEHQADIYGLEVIHGLVPDSSQVAARAFQHLGEKGLAYPEPAAWYVLWAYDHPTIADRVRFAVDYRPWDRGLPAKYVH